MSRWRAIRLVAGREIIERGRSRGYVLSLVFTVVLMGVGFIVPSLLIGQASQTRVALIAETPPGLAQALDATAAAFDQVIVVSTVPDGAAADEALRAGSVDAALAVPADGSSAGQLLVLEDAPSALQAIVNQAVISVRAGPAASEAPTVIPLEPPKAEDETALIFANAGIILMFIGIFSYGSWVLTGVVEEKQSRVVEVVLSTVRPRDLLMGKVLGIGLLALAQLVVLVAVGLTLSQLLGRLTLPTTTPGAVVQLLIWFILGFAFYSTTMGFLGSLASRIEEASTASMPVTLTATTAYILSLVVVTGDPDGLLARVMTFLPPSAPMVVPLRTALGAIEPWEVILSMALMIATIYVLFVVGARVYSGAVLQTGGRIKLRDAWRASR
ncbi:MAG TPA: ABC transporter permease [Candidatus Limnocylindrales bacterium]|jgi:ABC-2 type transport system permease protein|nr:ABC transporter permease [Candidatus Limnocylindrales bacterium]